MNERSDLPDRDDAWHGRAAEMLRAASPPFDRAQSLRRIETRIQAERAWQAATAGRAERPARGSRWFVGGWGIALGAAAALVVVGLAPRGFWSSADEPALEALSGRAATATPAGRTVFTVAFRPGVTLADVGRLVAGAGGEVVGGPSALGLWRVAVPSGERDAALARLRASPLVEAVAPEP